MDLGQMFPGVGPYAKNLQDLYTPYNPSVIPGLDMISYKGNPSTGGYVDRRQPGMIWLNQNADMKKDFPQTIPHEMEHVLQNRVDSRKPGGTGYDGNVLDEYYKASGWRGTPNELIKTLTAAGANQDIPKYFQEKYKYPIAYYGKFGGDQYSLSEQWAELSAAEQYLRKDLTKDPYVKKNIFNDDEALIRTYKGTTGLRTDRWDARDLPPMTANPSQEQVQAIQKAREPSLYDKVLNFFK